MSYRGRIAPTPTGQLHLGHARTFAIAWQRCRDANGVMIYRDENLDPQRCKPEFAEGAIDDLRWLGLDWDEGPDVGGPHVPYRQSERIDRFRDVWRKLRGLGVIYPCERSRREVRAYFSENPPSQYPDEQDAEPVFPPEWRPEPEIELPTELGNMNWRCRVPDGRQITFEDGNLGLQAYVAGQDFGDFLIWRKEFI